MGIISDEERAVLHRMLDKMCDDGQTNLIWEAYFHGVEPMTMKKEWLMLQIGIKEDKQE